MEDLITALLVLCMSAKKNGHDVMFSYAPHVMSVDIASYEFGYPLGRKEGDYPEISRKYCLYFDDEMFKADEYKEAVSYLRALVIGAEVISDEHD